MQASYRYGDPETVAKYPLAAQIGLVWRRRMGRVWCEIALPPCPPNHIIVPSLSVGQTDYRYEASLWRQRRDLAPATRADPREAGCSATASVQRHPAPSAPTSTASTPTPHCRPAAWPSGFAKAAPPERYLAVASIGHCSNPRQIRQQRTSLPSNPLFFSQMQAPDDMRRRICSPTALAMLLQASDPDIDWMDTVARCFDPSTSSYGCWPLAIRCAAAHGRIGAVEALPSWAAVVAVLDAGLPLVASIRFAEGSCRTPPLAKTRGHLVTCYGHRWR